MKLYKHLIIKWRELILTLILSIFSYNIRAQEIDSLIIWDKNNKLSWDDFLGAPNYNQRVTALSFLEIQLIRSYHNYEIYSYTIIPTFNRYRSFSKDKISDNLLEHEQLHFDIQEIFARKIRKQFQQLKKDNACDISYIEVYNKYTLLLKKYQYKFDISTNYSSKKIKQQMWYTIILNKLNKLDLYSVENFYGIQKN